MQHDPSAIAPRQSGPAAWIGSELAADPQSWTLHLTDQHVSEIFTASAPYADGDDDLPLIEAADFPLATFAAELAKLRQRLIRGRGFELVRGLPVEDIPVRQAAAAFLGVGAHLGAARSQNAAGHLLGHVRDLGADASDPNVRIYQTSRRQSFHTDSTDVVGLLCLETAQQGGDSLVASAATVYNEMLERDPGLAALLFEPIATDRRGEVGPGQLPYFEIPVLTWYDSALTVMYQRQYIESAQRFEDAPRLTPEKVAALDLLDSTVNDPALHLRMTLQPGDMQFVHNHSLLHDRTGFVNKPEAPRHLLRLWLSVPGDRELPEAFIQRYGSITVGDRGGIVTAGTRPHAPPYPTG